MIKYIKKKNQKGMEILIDQYNALITSVVRYHLGTLIGYEEECVSDTLLAI
jgi:RNA polymerase sigma-70 factor (ECF subfamily)